MDRLAAYAPQTTRYRFNDSRNFPVTSSRIPDSTAVNGRDAVQMLIRYTKERNQIKK